MRSGDFSTLEEDAAITAAALSDPDAQPLTDAQLAAMVPIKTLHTHPRRLYSMGV